MDRIIEVFRALLAFVGLLMVAMWSPACAATPVDVIKPDLHALIRAAAPSPVQFAVHVPHAVSSATSGTWSNSNGRATWRFNAQIPPPSRCPSRQSSESPGDAVLTVRAPDDDDLSRRRFQIAGLLEPNTARGSARLHTRGALKGTIERGF